MAARDDDLGVINAVPFVLAALGLVERNERGLWTAVPNPTLFQAVDSTSTPAPELRRSRCFKLYPSREG